MTSSIEILAIIPARGGSKGIPGKNIKPVAGKPLLAHSIDQALATPEITRVIVSTDDDEIAAVAEQYGAEVVRRPADISGDQATSESALVHTLSYLKETEDYEPDLVVFLQATSPLRQPEDISNAIRQLAAEEADSLFSSMTLEGFLWRIIDEQVGALSYDYHNRQRRQDIPWEDVIENGSIYIFKPHILHETNNRLGGKITTYIMKTLDSFQVDSPEDLELIRQLAALRGPTSIPAELADIRLLALDFDGVMTDNRVWVDETGREAVFAHRGDGMGIGLVRKAGIGVVVLSTETNPVVAARCAKLGIDCYQGLGEKRDVLVKVAAENKVDLKQVAFVGNDVNDLGCLEIVGLPVAVADAVPAVKQAARLILNTDGGRGAMRELCDLILEQKQ